MELKSNCLGKVHLMKTLTLQDETTGEDMRATVDRKSSILTVAKMIPNNIRNISNADFIDAVG